MGKNLDAIAIYVESDFKSSVDSFVRNKFLGELGAFALIFLVLFSKSLTALLIGFLEKQITQLTYWQNGLY